MGFCKISITGPKTNINFRERKMNRNRFTALSCVSLMAIMSMPAVAQVTGSAPIEIQVGAQPLELALNSLAQQFGKQIVISTKDARGLKVNLVKGIYSEQQALELLLAGSGLEYRYLNDRTIAIYPEGAVGNINFQKISYKAGENYEDNLAVYEEDETKDEVSVFDEVIVTGSRIAGASDSGAIAVTTLSRDDIDSYGENGTGDILANLPQAGSFEINDSSDGPNDARGDVATVNLRGLGTGNTLILLNGRRITAHGISQDVGSVPRQITNVNAFPSGAIDRIEVLRDGASALYGADATAGVVNTILSTDYEKTRVTVRRDFLEGTNSDEFSVDFATGFKFNEDRTKVIVTGAFYTRDGLFASELDGQFNNVDKRAFLGDSPWAESSDFRNTSSSSPFGRFEVISSFDKITGIFEDENVDLDAAAAALLGLSDKDLTSGGTFHIQPCNFNSRSRVQIGNTIDGCMAIGEGTLPRELRYDFNGLQPVNSFGDGKIISVDERSALGRQLISDTDRYNFYTLAEHEFDNGMEAFGEFLYYRSETESQRAASPLTTSDGIVIPKTNYFNPFGAIGTVNRLEGLKSGDVPDEGFDILIRNWRPQAGGPRIIRTKSTTYRVLGGLRGEYEGWDWEGSLGYSGNNTQDSENRISKTLLTEALARSTPDALNPFGSNANSFEQLQAISVDVVNKGSTSLTTADFRFTKADVLSNWAGDIGMAFGIDYRNESYKEDRDARLDGTIQFDGIRNGVSDIVSVSPTLDSQASRNVVAAYGEALVPIMEPRDGFFSNEFNLQLALRAEYFDDIKETTVTPKIAASYFPVRGFNFRAAYSEGFRAPNLVQLNRGDISRVATGDVDFVRENAIGAPEDTGDANLRSVRISNPDLESESTETIVLGFSIDVKEWVEASWLDFFDVSFDYWNFEQTGIIDNFGVQEALALDFALRLDGSSNPNVIRTPVTAEDQILFDAYNAANPTATVPIAGQVLFVNDQIINLDRQKAEGFDIGVQSGISTDMLGSFKIRFEFSKLLKLDIFRNEELVALVSDPRFEGEFGSLAVDRIKVNGNPEWRGTASLTWRKGAWGAGASLRYVSGFFDTSADNVDIDGDGEDDFFEVGSQTKVNAYIDYRVRLGNDESWGPRIRFGVNNLTDATPPIADESRGFRSSVHSIRGREYYMQLRFDF
ncbi:MAG: TonB-dependent receptor [Alphaproteobacteria bacterium]|nr:MAG: TonB-dependent receptor [Alphaproteobacteria bacterium]